MGPNKDGGQCHQVSAPSGGCHITPTCHVSRTCHVTPACHVRAPCHVTPYVCGCSLSHNSQSLQQESTTKRNNSSLSHTSSQCSHNVDQSVISPLNNSMQTPLDMLNFKLSNLSSCPTSPSIHLNQCNPWSHLGAQNSSKELLNSQHFFQPPTNEHFPNVHQCSSSQHCSFHSLGHHHSQQNFHQNLGSSNVYPNVPELQATCVNSLCPNEQKIAFSRQLSCPNAPSCGFLVSCSCMQNQQQFNDKQQQHNNFFLHQQREHKQFDNNCKSPMNVDVPEISQFCMSGSQQPEQQWLHLSEQLKLQHQTNEFCFQSELPRNKGDNIVILNSSSGGGMIIERKEPPRSNSPELKMTLSLPISNSVSNSGSSSPIAVNSFSFDRETLLQTLASLPTIATPTSSVLVSQSTGTNQSNPVLAFSFSNNQSSHAPQMFSTIPSVSPVQSTNSSGSPSPVSFINNERLACPDEIMNRNSAFDFGTFNLLSNPSSASNINNHFITSTNQMFPGVQPATQPHPTAKQVSVPAHEWTSLDDDRVLRMARAELEESGWYYGGLTWREAGAVLAGSPEGSYLVRDSWSGRCLYALSLQTSRGPTSVRIEYENGKFRLESETGARDGVPQKSSVVALVQAYTQTSNPAHVWVDHSGQTVSAISVKKPLRKIPPSLQHLARLSFNSSPAKPDLLDSRIPNLIKAFLNSYPHSC